MIMVDVYAQVSPHQSHIMSKETRKHSIVSLEVEGLNLIGTQKKREHGLIVPLPLSARSSKEGAGIRWSSVH